MKRINFTKLKIQNFLSIGKTPIEINFREGLNIITGSNKDKPDRRNAVGKSSIIDAFYFAIFGESLRGIKRDNMINNITGGTSHIELDFSIITNNNACSYKIIRNLNPSKVFLYKNDEDITRDSIKNTNTYINQLLESSQTIFENCVIMAINTTIPFMAKTKIDKRKFIEGICGMEIFGIMLLELRAQYNALKREYDLESIRLEEVKKALQEYKTQQANALQKQKDELQKLKLKQKENIDEKKALLEKLKNHKIIIHDEISKQKNILLELIDGIDDQITALTENCANKKTIVNYKKEIFRKIGTQEDKCPVCLKPITEQDCQNIEKERKELLREIKILVDQIEETLTTITNIKNKKQKIKTDIEDIEKQITEYRVQQQEKNNIKERVEQINKQQEEINQELKLKQLQETDFDEIIEETNKRYKTLYNKLNKLLKNINILDIVKYVISEEGVKSYIVNKILEILNSKLIHYLQKLDSNIICLFNEYFEEEILNEKGKICSYFNFSGAERKTIDLACLFAFNDLRKMQGGVSYNVVFYDELFDSSFDEKGIDLILDIIKERIEQHHECVMIISHRKESIKAVTGEVIYLEKMNGITYKTEFVQM